jgi:RNA-binding protein YlmH
MGAGIAREAVGDICVGKGYCDFFVTAEIAPYVEQSFFSAGRTKLHLTRIPLRDAHIPEPEVKEIKDTVASKMSVLLINDPAILEKKGKRIT